MIVNAVIVEPGKHPERKLICTDPMMIKAELGASSYEMLYPFKDKSVAIITSEHAAEDGEPFNRALYEKDGVNIKNIIQGRFLIVGANGTRIRSLEDEEIRKYTKMFYFPEKFSYELGDVKVLRYNPQKRHRDERQKRAERMNEALKQMLSKLPEAMKETFNEFVEAASELHRFEKRESYQRGIELGREYNSTQ